MGASPYGSAPSAATGYTGDFEAMQNEILRRRRMAELLQQQAMQPSEEPRGGGRMSFLHPIAKMLQGVMAAQGLESAKQDEAAMNEKKQAAFKAQYDARPIADPGDPGSAGTGPLAPPPGTEGLAREQPGDAGLPPATQPIPGGVGGADSPPMLPQGPLPTQFNFSPNGAPMSPAQIAQMNADIQNNPAPTPPPMIPKPPDVGYPVNWAQGGKEFQPAKAARPAMLPGTPQWEDAMSRWTAGFAPFGKMGSDMALAGFKYELGASDRQLHREDINARNEATLQAKIQDAYQRSQDKQASAAQVAKAEADLAMYRQDKLDFEKRNADNLAAYRAGQQEKPPVNYRWSKDIPGTAEPIPGGPADLDVIAKKREGGINIAGGRESVYTSRVMQAANQASKDLANIVQIPVESQTSGWLGGRKQGTGLFDATKEVLAQKVTPQEAQTYNVMATGLQRTLAAVETSGLAQGVQEFSKQIDVISKEGDTNLTKLHKLAQMRQIIEAGLEPILVNPRVADEQKQMVQRTMDSVKAAVPFTHSDLIELTRKQEINPDTTLKTMLAKSAAKVPEFKTDADAAAAEAAGTLKKGDRIKLGGVLGTWQ